MEEESWNEAVCESRRLLVSRTCLSFKLACYVLKLASPSLGVKVWTDSQKRFHIRSFSTESQAPGFHDDLHWPNVTYSRLNPFAAMSLLKN